MHENGPSLVEVAAIVGIRLADKSNSSTEELVGEDASLDSIDTPFTMDVKVERRQTRESNLSPWGGEIAFVDAEMCSLFPLSLSLTLPFSTAARARPEPSRIDPETYGRLLSAMDKFGGFSGTIKTQEKDH